MVRSSLPVFLALALCVWFPASARSADGDEIVGTWEALAPNGMTQYWVIKNENGEWSVSGYAVSTKDDKEQGSFVGKNVKYAGGSLTFQVMAEKPGGVPANGAAIQARVNGGKIRFSFRGGAGGVGTGALDKSKMPRDGSDVVGRWRWSIEGGMEEEMIIKRDKDEFSVNISYYRDGKEVGKAHGNDVKYAYGKLTYKHILDKKPVFTWGDGHDVWVHVSDEKTGKMSWRAYGGGSRKIERAKEPDKEKTGDK